jgi:hypothetical protein
MAVSGLACAALAPSSPPATAQAPGTARTKLHLGGLVAGLPAHVVCLGKANERWINLDFPVDGGCEGTPPTRVTYDYVDSQSRTIPGGGHVDLASPLRPKDKPLDQRRLRFKVPRWLSRDGGPALDVIAEGYGLEVTVTSDCDGGGDTRGQDTCWFTAAVR